ncbi:hypothetical protein ACHAWO_007127 [Cyclotella atomus]|uniref:Aminoacyl-transfer RNA synthetases class-II family profile domain-containing protein n=1 Tax=Cyclotella atomus TaxID=382360 RepID=A0ABD3PR96_9STRA
MSLDTDDVASLRMERSFLVSITERILWKSCILDGFWSVRWRTHVCALGDVYTFGPTFRTVNSQTTRHLAEFWMVEPEMAFADMTSAMNNAESMPKAEKCDEDLKFFAKQVTTVKLRDKPFMRCSYRQQWGTCRMISKDRSNICIQLSKEDQAFCMRDNDEDGGETVNPIDLLVPGVGEIVGESQREERLDVLIEKIKDLELDVDDYWWYLDLRRFGSVPHAGYGLGFERLVTM